MAVNLTPQYLEAEAEYKKVIELEPAYSDAYIQLASVYQNKGDIQKATEFITKAASDLRQ